MELLAEELGQLDGDEDAGEEEGHGVGDGGDGDTGFAPETEGVHKVV